MAKRKTLLNSANGIKRREFLKIAATVAAAVAVPVLAQVQTDVGTLDKEQAAKGFPSKPPYSPYAGRDFPTRPFFGDTHLHTSFSMDAGAFGARLGPKEAYRFAKGRRNYGFQRPARKALSSARFPGCLPIIPTTWAFSPNFSPATPTSWQIRQAVSWYDMIQSGKGAEAAIDIIVSFSQGKFPKALESLPGTAAYRSAWRETIKAAEESNDPGRFTRFHRLRMDIEHGRKQPAP